MFNSAAWIPFIFQTVMHTRNNRIGIAAINAESPRLLKGLKVSINIMFPPMGQRCEIKLYGCILYLF